MDYIIYFVITIGLLVFVHEFGHFAAAKMMKMRADIFAIGFGKRLFGYNKITGFTFGDLPADWDGGGYTDYRLCLLPLGGYVKIAGMIDESMDTDFTEKEPQPYEFRAKSTPAKLFVISAGVLMNLLLTVVIFWGINFVKGEEIWNTTKIGAIADTSYAAGLGFESYDKILRINGEEIDNFGQIHKSLIINNLGRDVNVTVNRNGQVVQFTIDKEKIAEKAQKGFYLPPAEAQAIISEIVEKSPAEKSGLKSGDAFISIAGNAIANSEDVIKYISAFPDSTIEVVMLRSEDTVNAAVTPSIDGKIGIGITNLYTGEVTYRSYGFIGSLQQSFVDVAGFTVLTYDMMKRVIAGDVEFGQVFGGPGKIAQFAAKSADAGLSNFLAFLAALSLSLAIINILPFPVLDGGHFVIILIEGIAGREIPLKLKIAIQNTGFVILMLLMIFIIYSDIVNW